MPPQQILLPLPSEDFDPTEAAVPWKILRAAGHRVYIATPDAQLAHCDPRMLNGEGLGMFKSSLIADANGKRAYAELEASGPFHAPVKWADVSPSDIDGLLLPGGHAQGMRPYLESKALQALVSGMFAEGKPVAAICHGVLLVARSKIQGTSRSVLHGRRTTALTRPQEMLAYTVTRPFVGTYYRTYPDTTVEDEVIANLAAPTDFERGHGLTPPSTRDGPRDFAPGFTLRDGSYLSARWPGDAHKFGHDFAKLLAELPARETVEEDAQTSG